nr:shieldin complex subunit 3 [Nerophis lumbriciformis]
MEDVVLYHRLEGSDGLNDLIATTEKLLEPLPCRPPPVFSPWFAYSSAERPPPIRPAKPAPVIRAADLKNGSGMNGPLNSISAKKKRSWNVLASKGGRQRMPSLSRRFYRTLSAHALHPHQRSKWVISQQNCGAARDIEQVWRALSRAAQRAGLPTCNANIQRERAEIWVFCDVMYSEQVGHFLKERLQLSGNIALSVHRLGDVFIL